MGLCRLWLAVLNIDIRSPPPVAEHHVYSDQFTHQDCESQQWCVSLTEIKELRWKVKKKHYLGQQASGSLGTGSQIRHQHHRVTADLSHSSVSQTVFHSILPVTPSKALLCTPVHKGILSCPWQKAFQQHLSQNNSIFDQLLCSLSLLFFLTSWWRESSTQMAKGYLTPMSQLTKWFQTQGLCQGKVKLHEEANCSIQSSQCFWIVLT